MRSQIGAQSAGAVEYTDCISTYEQDPSNECPGYDIQQSDGEVPLLEFWEMRSTPSLLLPGPLSPGVVVPDKSLSMDLIEFFDI